MKAIVYDRYGPPDVAKLDELPKPEARAGEILVRVGASSVSTADWRMRASAFPGGLWLPGRMLTGLFRPKNRVLGVDFAGTVEAVGAGVTGFAPGDRVFGFRGSGGHAEYLTIAEDAAVARTPDVLSDAEAAALPFGGLAALVFLRDFARIGAGTRVLVMGASGGVGAYAVQIAKALGAQVTGVASSGNMEFVRGLGADEAIDYRTEDFTRRSGGWDVILDTVRQAEFGRVKRALAPGGAYVPLNFGLLDMLMAGLRGRLAGRRFVTAINGDTREDLEALAEMVIDGRLRPVIDEVFPMGRIAEAYARVEGRSKRGAVVLGIGAPEAVARVA